MLIACLLSGCLGDIVLGGGAASTSKVRAQSKPVINPNTGEAVQMWVPKKGMVPSQEWESFARAEEKRCASGYYEGKSDTKLLPSQRGVYKKTKNGGWIWAYYFYYGEDSPLATGGTMTIWYETIFNIYVNSSGRIYGCIWQKYPFGWSNKHGTTDGIEATVQSPR